MSADSSAKAYSWYDGVTLGSEVVHKRGYQNHHPSNDDSVSRSSTKAIIGRARESDHYECYSDNDQTPAPSAKWTAMHSQSNKVESLLQHVYVSGGRWEV
jgi:hypothetical protein